MPQHSTPAAPACDVCGDRIVPPATACRGTRFGQRLHWHLERHGPNPQAFPYGDRSDPGWRARARQPARAPRFSSGFVRTAAIPASDPSAPASPAFAATA